MSFADVWNRTLVYFGIAEEDDEWDEDGYLTEEDLERTYSERPNVRRLTPRRRQQQDFDDWTDPEPEETAACTPRLPTARSRARAGRTASSSAGPVGAGAPRAPARASTTRSRSPTASRTRFR